MIITSEKELRVKCSDVLPEEADALIKKLEKELEASAIRGAPGIGLAAPQIGIPKKAAIIRISDKYSVNLINAKIKSGYSKALFDNEGCLSFPGRYESTMRYQEIHVVDNMCKPHSFIAKGLLAVVIQHELGHLSGELLPDVALKKVRKNKIRPNDKCSCGSGKKYKKCCGK